MFGDAIFCAAKLKKHNYTAIIGLRKKDDYDDTLYYSLVFETSTHLDSLVNIEKWTELSQETRDLFDSIEKKNETIIEKLAITSADVTKAKKSNSKIWTGIVLIGAAATTGLGTWSFNSKKKKKVRLEKDAELEKSTILSDAKATAIRHLADTSVKGTRVEPFYKRISTVYDYSEYLNIMKDYQTLSDAEKFSDEGLDTLLNICTDNPLLGSFGGILKGFTHAFNKTIPIRKWVKKLDEELNRFLR